MHGDAVYMCLFLSQKGLNIVPMSVFKYSETFYIKLPTVKVKVALILG